MNGTAHAAAAPGTGPVADVGEYAARVRAHLAGLPQDQVDDLTDGLEADLADALADPTVVTGTDPGDLVARFGEPSDYARELRLAAGLPEPAPATARPRGPRAAGRRLAARVHAGGRRMAADLDAQPWWPPVREFLVTLRPVWWLVRAWVAYQLIVLVAGRGEGWLPRDLVTVVLLAVLMVVSVQWGRGRWLPRRVRWVPALVSVAAVVLFVPAVAVASDAELNRRAPVVEYYPEYVESGVPFPQDGVWVDGMQVSNLFAYDAEGNPLHDVQLYDDRGRPVRTTSDGGWGEWSLPGVEDAWSFVPVPDEDGRRLWNVYPLRGAPSEEFDWDAVGDGVQVEDTLAGDPRTPPRPFAQAPALADASAQDESPAPDASVAPTPTPEATP